MVKVIQSLNPNKAYGHDGVSVRILKLSWPCIIKPLLFIFCNCLKYGTFLDDWKKDNLVPVHKKDNKQIVSNYPPVLFVPQSSKTFEELVFDIIFEFMIENNLLNSNQSGFKPNNSCVNPGGLNKKEPQLNICNIFSIFISNGLYLLG